MSKANKLRKTVPLELASGCTSPFSKADIGLIGKFNWVLSILGDSAITSLDSQADETDDAYSILVIKAMVDSEEVLIPFARSTDNSVLADVATSIQALHVSKMQGVPSYKLSCGTFVILNESIIEVMVNQLSDEMNVSDAVIEHNETVITISEASSQKTVRLTSQSTENAVMFVDTLKNVIATIPLNKAVVDCLENGTETTVFALPHAKMAIMIFSLSEYGFVQLNENAHVLVNMDGVAMFLLNTRFPAEGEAMGMIEIQRSIYADKTVRELMEEVNSK